MEPFDRLTWRTAVMALVALTVVGGIVVALLSGPSFGTFGSSVNGLNNIPSAGAANSGLGPFGFVAAQPNGGPLNDTQIIGQVTTMASTTTAVNPQGGPPAQQASTNVTGGSPAAAGGLIEFSSNVGIRSSSPEQSAAGVIALAYSVGGYVAYQSTTSTSAYVVIRVPAAEYQSVLIKVEGMGVVLTLSSNSNDVRVQYTDLNATLASLRTEQGALLKLLNQSSTINSTLAIEGQLQQVNQQINDIESQILQTRTLIQYSTIDVTITENPEQSRLSLTLSATPTNGSSPLSVTFNAIVKGGSPSYVVNYNFGDGTAAQGQVAIHTYYEPGNYKALVTATDQNGTVVQNSTVVKVVAVPGPSGVESYLGYVGGLFLSVVEGIVEVAVVVLPLAAVGAAIIIPIQRRGKSQKAAKQSD